MTTATAWVMVAFVSWTAAAVLGLHLWRRMRDDDVEYVPFHLCQWVSCRSEATNQVQVHHPAGDIRLWVCDDHLRWACRAQDQAAEVYDQAMDELEDLANKGRKP